MFKGMLLLSHVTQEVKEFRFAKGKICLHCNAKLVEINIAASFFWSHKILDFVI